jgi:hypothetical protein
VIGSEQPGQQEGRPKPSDAAGARLQVLATEHWSLLATRSLVYTESFSRVSLFLSVLTGAIVALALLAQVDHFRDMFMAATILILSVVVFVGVVTVARLRTLNRENFLWIMGMNRLRHAYLEMFPDLEGYFVAGIHDDLRGVTLSMGLPTDLGKLPSIPRRTRLADMLAGVEIYTLPAMVMVIVALVAGVLVALIAGWLGAPTFVAIAVATVIFLATNVLAGMLATRAFFAFARSLPIRFPSSPPPPAGQRKG